MNLVNFHICRTSWFYTYMEPHDCRNVLKEPFRESNILPINYSRSLMEKVDYYAHLILASIFLLHEKWIIGTLYLVIAIVCLWRRNG